MTICIEQNTLEDCIKLLRDYLAVLHKSNLPHTAQTEAMLERVEDIIAELQDKVADYLVSNHLAE